MTDPSDSAPAKGSLVLARTNQLGTILGLQADDRLIAVNGLPISADPEMLAARIGPSGRATALTMERAGLVWNVLTDTAQLGMWRPGPPPVDRPDGPKGRIYPEALQNWEILRAPDGRYDVLPVALPKLALIAPPLWLMQTRLWGSLALWTALVLLGIPLGWPAVLALHALSAVYFWKSGPTLWRTDRLARGLGPDRVLASASETALHAQVRALYPGATYLHMPSRVTDDTVVETS